MEYYIHSVPGRLRLKSPFFKNVDTHHNIKKMLANLRGIATTDFNAVTGSIVLYYSPAQIKVNEIVSTFQRSGYFDPAKAITNDQYIKQATSKVGNIVGRAVFGAMVDRAFEGSALSLLAVLL